MVEYESDVDVCPLGSREELENYARPTSALYFTRAVLIHDEAPKTGGIESEGPPSTTHGRYGEEEL
jgi:hypothetical protein